jgi:phenylalanyl-tRNA synthetase beta chain
LGLGDYLVNKIKEGKGVDLKVENQELDLCPRYIGLVVDNVKVGPSPDWLAKDLQAVGLRPINNIVDITNYILMDLGQPMHAFDAKLIKDNKIVVRRAKAKEKFMTLDEEEKSLTTEDLVIADSDKPVALAGVIGGLNSGVNEQTTTIIFEAANFEPYSVRKTSERHGIRTESSTRFEKGLDPELPMLAMQKAVEMLLEFCPEAKVASSLEDLYAKQPEKVVIETSYEFLKQRIGQELDDGAIKNILERLGFEVKGKSGEIKVQVPSWRATKDVSIPEDLVEEVARMFGYDNLEPQMPLAEVELPEVNKLRELERVVKNILVNAGRATEVYNYSFVSQEQEKLLGTSDLPHIKLENPAAEGQDLMRRTLVHGLLDNIKTNSHNFDQINIFEIGRVFLLEPGTDLINPEKKATLPDQPLYASGVILDNSQAPFYQAKGLLSLVLEQLKIDYQIVKPEKTPVFIHPHRSIIIKYNDKIVGLAGEVHPAVLSRLEIEKPVGWWQLDLSELVKDYQPRYKYQPISKYPAIELDLSLVLDEKVEWQAIKDVVKQGAPELIREINLFDVYKNDKIGVGKRSLAFHIVYQSDKQTLEMEQVQKVHQDIIKKLEKSFSATVRQ